MERPVTRTHAPLLSIVVPTRNEAENVEALTTRLAEVLAGIPSQVVFVDDSDDDTGRILDRLAAGPPGGLEIVVVKRPTERRTGLGSAAAEGLKLATADVIAVMDGDLQHPPEVLRSMMAALQGDDLDVAVASRYVTGGSPSGLSGPARRVASAVSRRLVQVLFREARKTSDPLSGYFLVRKSAIDGLEFRPIGFKILLEILVLASSATVGDVPLAFDKRHGGRSNASVQQGISFLKHLWSLVAHVPGSARVWKYAAVGGSGLVVFIGLLFLGRWLGLGAFQSWAVAFTVSLGFNWQVNRLLTFADVESPFTPGPIRPVYLPVALLGGCANLVVFTILLSRYGQVRAGVGGAVTAMTLNYVVHRRLLRRPPRWMSAGGPPPGQQSLLDRVRRIVDGDVQMLPADADEEVLAAAFARVDSPPAELLLAAGRRRPIILAEGPSNRAQPRRDVGLSAWMGVPVLEGRRYLGLIVVHRHGAPYNADELNQLLGSLRADARGTLPPQHPSLVPDVEGGEVG